LEGRADPLYHSVRRPHLRQLKSDPFTQKFGHALVFPDAALSNASFYSKGADLEVHFGTGQGVLVKNQLSSSPVVEFMMFGDQVYSAAHIATLVGVPS
ncbi:hypothetical protein, partial [Alicycliphilus denitrificans]|uniref:hypothetical protein n=1 Tax=Alicycliphilus denitrificans TaxID=179636 RepID=UPI001CA49BFE